ncbi:MAG: hypothetical protein EA425_12660 [Puniceicoccaceae bacterium]|nr:MAG: hypothetical protein EA425_12660 [Puniceicoccaceae bacterium]
MHTPRTRFHPPRFTLWLLVAAILLPPATAGDFWTLDAPMDLQPDLRLETTGLRPTLPIKTDIAIEVAEDATVAARVTLAFPNSGYEVTDWGEVMVTDEGEFWVGVGIHFDPDQAVLPVITERSHTYTFGPLEKGDYRFTVLGGRFVLGSQSFRVDPGAPPPPVPAKAAIDVRASPHQVNAGVRVWFGEMGWRVIDWGEPRREGSTIHLQATAARPMPLPPVPQEERLLTKNFHRYNLGTLPAGEYAVEFHLNGHLLAAEKFVVRPEPAGWAVLQADPVTAPNSGPHPLRVAYFHPAGIDPDSLGDHNLRVSGPHGFEASARFLRWEPSPYLIATPGLIAHYEVDPPGKVWTSDDNGRYAVILRHEAVKALDGSGFPRQLLGHFAVRLATDPVPHPMPTHGEIEIITRTVSGEKVHTAKVRIGLPATNVEVADWGTVQRRGNKFWADVKLVYTSEFGNPVVVEKTHAYRLGTLVPGRYGFTLLSRGRPVAETRFAVRPDVLPRARLLAAPVTEASKEPHLVRVRFFSPAGMDLETIRQAGVRVIGPNDYGAAAKLVSLETFLPRPGPGVPAVPVTQAVYAVPPPRPDGWTARANGAYRVFIAPDTVADLAGNLLPGGLLGSFRVAIRPDFPRPDRPSSTLAIEYADDGTVLATITFLPGGSGWVVADWSEELKLVGNRFMARAEIVMTENETPGPAVFRKTYRLGRLQPSLYVFGLYGSNGFISHHPFRVPGPPVRPLEAWRHALRELTGGEPPEANRLPAYAFGGGLHRGQVVRPELRRDGDGAPRLLIRYPEVPGADDIRYRVEFGKTLDEWNDLTGFCETLELAETPYGLRERTVVLRGLEDAEEYRFARIRAYLAD